MDGDAGTRAGAVRWLEITKEVHNSCRTPPIATVLKPAGLDKSTGQITGVFAKDPVETCRPELVYDMLGGFESYRIATPGRKRKFVLGQRYTS
jgi:hypothetical protein